MKTRQWWALAADGAVVAAFVTLGRDTHEAPFSVSATIAVVAPFLMALAAMWLLPIVRVEPWRLAAGAAAGAGTAALGLTLRALVFDDGISGAFPIVAFVFLTVGMTTVRGLVGRRMDRLAVR